MTHLPMRPDGFGDPTCVASYGGPEVNSVTRPEADRVDRRLAIVQLLESRRARQRGTDRYLNALPIPLDFDRLLVEEFEELVDFDDIRDRSNEANRGRRKS
jgi:hypothetical protein